VRSRFSNHLHRQWLISLLLVAIGVRALIPAGFMPATDRPFSFQICPDGFPAQLLHDVAIGDEHAAHHHGQQQQDDTGSTPEHGAARAEHCVFAVAAGAGPAPQIALLVAPAESQAAPQASFTIRIPELTRHRVQQPRAPPTLS
jgi:hypothetical protein